MAPVTIPPGFAFVPRRSDANVAKLLLEAAEELELDLITSVRTTFGGYHVVEAVADRYRENLEETGEVVVEENSTDPASTETNPDGTAVEQTSQETTEELPPLPVTAESSNAEIDAYADGLEPKVDLSSAKNRAEKIELLEAARQPKTETAE